LPTGRAAVLRFLAGFGFRFFIAPGENKVKNNAYYGGKGHPRKLELQIAGNIKKQFTAANANNKNNR
jgi:hypothetical protein